jgi:plasmid stability protein
MPQIVVRQIPDEVHRALKARAREHGQSAEAEVRDILSRAVLPDTRRKAGDLMCGVWEGAETGQVVFNRDQTPHEPMSFE